MFAILENLLQFALKICKNTTSFQKFRNIAYLEENYVSLFYFKKTSIKLSDPYCIRICEKASLHTLVLFSVFVRIL